MTKFKDFLPKDLDKQLDDKMNFNGLTTVNIELTSRCNATCWMCGRRKFEKEHPELCDWEDMKFELVEKIANQLPPDIIVQTHSNGEPTLYPKLKEALILFKKQIRTFNTNGRLLLEKSDDIINNMEVIVISVIENDPWNDRQYKIIKKFLKLKGDKKPRMIYRLLGDISKNPNFSRTKDAFGKDFMSKTKWHNLPGEIVTRVLHSPMGSFDYEKKVTSMEYRICLDILSHLVIDQKGNVFPCVRYNPNNYNLIGNINHTSLFKIWNGKKRKYLVKNHIKGTRKCSKLCKKCEYWGIPCGE